MFVWFQEECDMKTIGLYLTLTAVLLVLATDGEAQAVLQEIHCPGSSDQVHEDNLKNAILAEKARGYVDPLEACNNMNGHDSNGWDVQEIDEELVSRTISEWNENEERKIEISSNNIFTCSNDDGPYHRFKASYKLGITYLTMQNKTVYL